MAHGQFYGMGLVRTETMLENVTITHNGKYYCRRVLNRMRKWQNMPFEADVEGREVMQTHTIEEWRAYRKKISDEGGHPFVQKKARRSASLGG